MHKEVIISIIVVIAILGLNYVTQANTDQTMNEMNKHLEEVKNEIVKETPDQEIAMKKAERAYEAWEEFDDKMAYYVEHNEIEKVKTALTSMKSFIETKEYTQSIENIDRCIYILENIDYKEKITLDNIF